MRATCPVHLILIDLKILKILKKIIIIYNMTADAATNVTFTTISAAISTVSITTDSI
jgi:hypothetical protein